MSRESTEKVCCICLGSTLKLNRLTAKDGNQITIRRKLQMCVSEIEWLASYQICEQCTKLLDIAYTFRETCFKSHVVRVGRAEHDGDRDVVEEQAVNDTPYKLHNPEEGELGVDNVQIKDEIIIEATYEPNLENVADYLNYHDVNGLKLEKLEVDDVESDEIIDIVIDQRELDMENVNINEEIIDKAIKGPNSGNQLDYSAVNDFKLGEKQGEVTSENEGDKFECHLCHRLFTDKCILQRHTRTHSNVRKYKCSHCVWEYKNLRFLKIHMAKSHGIELDQVIIPPKKKKYICHICPKSYCDKNRLIAHLYTHSGYGCPVCRTKFKDKCYVKQHLQRIHHVVEVSQDKIDTLGINNVK